METVRPCESKEDIRVDVDVTPHMAEKSKVSPRDVASSIIDSETEDEEAVDAARPALSMGRLPEHSFLHANSSSTKLLVLRAVAEYNQLKGRPSQSLGKASGAKRKASEKAEEEKTEGEAPEDPDFKPLEDLAYARIDGTDCLFVGSQTGGIAKALPFFEERRPHLNHATLTPMSKLTQAMQNKLPRLLHAIENLDDEIVHLEKVMEDNRAYLEMALPHYKVEHAKSGRSRCKNANCGELIDEGSVRVGTRVVVLDHASFSFRHPQCFTNRQIRNARKFYPSADFFPGYENLSAEEQQAWATAFDKELPEHDVRPKKAEG